MIINAVRQIAASRGMRARRPPRLRTGHGSDGVVYFLCPDWPAPAGGNRTIYRFVDVLVANGVPAVALHHRRGFRYTWFDNDTPVVAAGDVTVCPRDVLVVPETSAPFLDELPDGPRLVVLNQNAYQTFGDLTANRVPYRRVSQIVAVSQDNADLLEFALPRIPVTVIPPSIDPAVFYPGPGEPGRRLAYMPRRRGEDARELFGILGRRLEGWELVPIDGRSIEATAELMRSCPLFLALGRREGFGLPAAEAMASGAYVVGFHGLAGREFMLPTFSRPVPEDDLKQLAFAVAEAVQHYERDPAGVRTLGRTAARFVTETYSPATEAGLVLQTFGADVRSEP